MRLHDRVCVTAKPGEMTQGLFGRVFLHVFEILPYLQKRKIYPAWSISSELYGQPPNFTEIPGLLDLAYPAPENIEGCCSLQEIRRQREFALGNDWSGLHRLWSAYFRVPARIEQRTKTFGDLSATLGIHYRGTDKNTAGWDSNSVSHDDFAVIIKDLLGRRPGLTRIFVATDEPEFIAYLSGNLEIPVVSFGAGRHHFEEKAHRERAMEADHALTDCMTLSRCAVALTTSSALSAFSKVLNPDLEIYRCAASKMFADIPYFPIAYIAPFSSDDAQVTEVLGRTMKDDWTTSATSRRFRGRFAFKRRASILSLLRRKSRPPHG
jgi:hypothetical protein